MQCKMTHAYRSAIAKTKGKIIVTKFQEHPTLMTSLGFHDIDFQKFVYL